MRKHVVGAWLAVLFGLLSVDRGDAQFPGHTSLACWKVPRQYHERYSDEFAKRMATRVSLESVPMSDPPKKTFSPNGAYWFAEEVPDTSRPGPWTTRLLVFNERRTLARLSLIDHASGEIRASWMNEKLLFVRVWWGRIVATDMIFDVEAGRFVYREMLDWGQIEFEQWKAQGEPCVVPPEQFSK